MALSDVSKKFAKGAVKGAVAASALPAFMAYQGAAKTLKPIARAVDPRNILASFADELGYFPIKAGFDQVYDKLGGRKKKDDKKKVAKDDKPVPVIVKNTEDLVEPKLTVERLPDNFWSMAGGQTSPVARTSSLDELIKKSNIILEEIKTILSGQLLLDKKKVQQENLKKPIDNAKKREQDDEAKKVKSTFPETSEQINKVDSGGLGLIGGLALLARGALIAGVSALVLTPFIETFVNDLAKGINIDQLIPGETGQMIDNLVKTRAGDFAGKIATFIGAKFLFGTKAAMLSVFADEMIRQFEGITDINIPDQYEGAISLAAGALAARYGKGIATKLLPMFTRILTSRLMLAINAFNLVNDIPNNPEDMKKFMEKSEKRGEDANKFIMDYVGKPVNDMLGFDFFKEKDDYENSPAKRIFGVFDDAGKSPLEMEKAEQIRISQFKGKAQDDFDMGKYQDPDLQKLSDAQNKFFKINPNITSEVPEAINKNNQAVVNSNKDTKGLSLQYNDNRQISNVTKGGTGGNNSTSGNIPLTTAPSVSRWSLYESIKPH